MHMSQAVRPDSVYLAVCPLARQSVGWSDNQSVGQLVGQTDRQSVDASAVRLPVCFICGILNQVSTANSPGTLGIYSRYGPTRKHALHVDGLLSTRHNLEDALMLASLLHQTSSSITNLPVVLAAAAEGRESALCLMPSLEGDLSTVVARPSTLPQLARVLPPPSRLLLLLLTFQLPQLARVLRPLVMLAVGDRGRPVRRAVCSNFCCARYFSL